MPRHKPVLALLLIFAVGCGATPIQREFQIAKGIVDTNDSATMALDFGIFTADQGVLIQTGTQGVAEALNKSIKARRAGSPIGVVDALLTAIEDSLLKIIIQLEKMKKGEG